MAQNTCEESRCVKKFKLSVINSIPIKNTNDKDYNTTSLISRNVLSNQSHLSKVICLDHTADFHMSSNTYNFTSNHNRNKRKIMGVTNSNTSYTSISSTYQDHSHKLNMFSDVYENNSVHQYFKCNNSVLHKNVCHKRINLEGQMKVDFMYYLSKRHNFVPVTEKIFSFLHGKDIITMSMVSKIWHNAVRYSPTAKSKKQYYLLYIESIKENHECISRRRTSLMSRTLADISNIIYSIPRHKQL